MLTNQLKSLLGRENKVNPFELLVNIHHVFLSQYGWISPEEFYNLDAQMVLDLLDKIIKENETINKGMPRVH